MSDEVIHRDDLARLERAPSAARLSAPATGQAKGDLS